MSSKLQKSLTDYNSNLVKEGEILYGNLGTFIGGRTLVSVPGRAGYVYVRLRTKLSELIEAFNSEVAQKYNTPVLIERKGNRYVVIGRNTETFSDWETNDPYIPQHAEQHIFDKDGGNMGGDPVWVYPYQFMPALVTPFGSRGAANVFLHSYPLHTENGWKYTGNTGTPKLTQYNPESGATLVLVTLDSQTGNPAIFATTGTFIPESVTGTSQLISYLPQVSDLRYLPDSFIRLVSGTSSIGWSNIYDVRQFLSYSPSGTASDHEALTGLLGGSVNDHWHMTPSQMIGLVSGTSTALHSHAGGIGTGTAGQLVKWGALGNTLVDAALIPPATNILTLTATAASTLGLAISAGKTITLTATDNSSITFTGASNLTIPTAGAVVAALLGTANIFTVGGQMVDSTADAIELRLQAHSTKTTDYLTIEKSTGAVVSGFDKTGRLYSHLGTSTTNLFIGAAAGNTTATGTDNIAMGSLAAGAGFYATMGSLTKGNQNFALGSAAMRALTEGNYNTALGIQTLYSVVTGGGNTAIGRNALFNFTGDACTAIGLGAGFGITTGYGGIFIGHNAGYNQTTIPNLMIIDNGNGYGLNRGSAALEITNSFMYGIMGATPAAQSLRLNSIVTIAVNTTTNNAPLVLFDLNAYVSTAATGFTTGGGVAYTMTGETATDGTSQIMAKFATLWTDATNATRKAKLQLSAYDTAQRIGLEIEASGSAAMIGLYGVTPIIRPTTASAAATFSQLSGNTVNDASTFDGYTLLQVVKALRDIGVLT